MKKLLGLALGLTMGATLTFGLAACNSSNDSDVAKEALETIRLLYEDEAVETPVDYEVLGKVNVNDTLYNIDWSVSSESFADLNNYVTVGTEMSDDYMITIGVQKATVEIEYKLTASVKVGKATESLTFDRKVPAGEDRGPIQTKTVAISFSDTSKRTEFDTSKDIQVWEQNGIKFTNGKGSTVVGDYFNPVRCYSGSTIKIEYPAMLHIDFHVSYGETWTDPTQYVVPLKNSLEALELGEVTVNEGLVSIELDTPVDVLEFKLSGQTRLDSIDIEGIVGGLNDEQKVAAAEKTLSLSQTIYSATGVYDLPTESNGAQLTWSVKETSEYVEISSNKLNVKSLPEEEDVTVTLVAAIKSNSANGSKELTITLKPGLGLSHAGTADDPFTTAEAKALAATLEADAFYSINGSVVAICVEGYVIEVGSWTAGNYNNWTSVYIASSPNSTKDSDDAFYVYRLNIDGTYLKGDGDLVKGAKIVVSGALQNYKGNTPEITNSGDIKSKAVSYEIPEGMHVHDWDYKHVDGTWTHTGTCLADGCDVNTITTDCVPANNTCSDCKHEYDVTEILTALQALQAGESLNGTYVLTGVVTDTPEAGNSGDLKFHMTVNDTSIYAYYVTPGSLTVKEGDTVTVSGPLKNFNGTLEFNNGNIIAVNGDSAVVDPTPGDDDEFDAMTVAEVLEIAATLESGKFYMEGDVAKKVYVAGYVTVAGYTYGAGYPSSIYIADVKGTSQNESLCLYSLTWNDVMTAANFAEMQAGDYIVAYGYITRYNDKLELDKNGSDYVTVEKWIKSDGTIDGDNEVPEGAITASVTMSQYATDNNWVTDQSVRYFTVNVDSNVTATINEGTTNNGKYYTTSNGTWRLYSTESAALTISLAAGYELVSFKITASEGGFGDYKINTSYEASGTTITLTASAKTFIQAIEVVYKAV